MLQDIYKKIVKIFDIESDSNKTAAIEQINSDVYLRGSNIVYLVCSALIASVGLDVSSPAVIIGAMLISPLMSPILGIGLSLGIHDRENFIISLRAFFLSIVISLLVSFIYFLVTPFGNPTAELLSRIKPTALDIIIAFFGGIAGIVAISRSKIAAALPGVAIATALMPPVCTAGFGLATGRFDYFIGAIYLFFINAVFISFSSYIVVKYLKFPLKIYLDRKRNIRAKIIISFFVFLVAVPSFFIFYYVIKDVRINKNIEKFVNQTVQTENTKVIEWKYLALPGDQSELNIYVVGDKISKGRLDTLNNLLKEIVENKSKINLTQMSDEKGLVYLKNELKTDMLSTVKLIQKSNEMQEKEIKEKISANDSLLLINISKDLKIFYPELSDVGFAENYLNTSQEKDSTLNRNIPIITLNWNKKISSSKINSYSQNIYSYIKEKTKADSVIIVNLK
jgi:uncharacterized hydrophobic protein (TIGR00271 family)